MMDLHGNNIIAGERVKGGGTAFSGIDAAKATPIAPPFHEATAGQVDQALTTADRAFVDYRQRPVAQIADFLARIGQEILVAGDDLLNRAAIETALPVARLTGERGRTVNQLHLFAELLREGSWVEAVIDHADADRKPIPKPDLRRMLIPIGPVAVFAASNFPLAFSVAGGDTASALAAGCPVVVKAHPGHPGTSEIVAEAIVRAAEACGMPAGVFSLLHGPSNELGAAIVRHPLTRAVGFTGSQAGGRALFDIAARRPVPIPVYAEMGSVNPVFILPGAAKQRGQQIAAGLCESVALGVGQFCTKPGLVIVHAATADAIAEELAGRISRLTAAPMLSPTIQSRYNAGVQQRLTSGDVQPIAQSPGGARAFRVDATKFLANPHLQEEIFGPTTLLVVCDDVAQMQAAVDALAGQLTVTLHGTDEDWAAFAPLIESLRQKAGRLIINGFPTGVEVGHAMNHGGPYPATTDVRTTSVGSAAIKRFARPVCFQDFPSNLLPPELREENPRQILRLVDGKFAR